MVGIPADSYIVDLTRPPSLVLSPGKFFAVNELKTLFAYIVMTYDIKFEEGNGVPRDICVAEMRSAGNANLLFRERQK
jgi:hypothetical protein